MNITKLAKEIYKKHPGLSSKERNHIASIVNCILYSYCDAKCGVELPPEHCRLNLENDGCTAKKHFEEVVIKNL